MRKWLVLPVFAFLLFLTAGFVSATHNSYGYGYWGDGYNYGGYGGYYDCGYGYSSYGNCYRTETFRDITENKRTTTTTSGDRFSRETTKTVTTTFTDIKRETRTPAFSYSSRTYYPRRAFTGTGDYSSSGFRRAFNPGYNYYETRYDYPSDYYSYSWGW